MSAQDAGYLSNKCAETRRAILCACTSSLPQRIHSSFTFSLQWGEAVPWAIKWSSLKDPMSQNVCVQAMFTSYAYEMPTLRSGPERVGPNTEPTLDCNEMKVIGTGNGTAFWLIQNMNAGCRVPLQDGESVPKVIGNQKFSVTFWGVFSHLFCLWSRLYSAYHQGCSH